MSPVYKNETIHVKIFATVTDTEIIQKITGGEIALFEILIRRNNPFLYKTGRSYGFNHEDTQDLMQDTFINAYLGLSSFKNQSSFTTWMTRIMLNNCYRKQKKFSFKYETSNAITEKSVPMFSNNKHPNTNHEVVNRELNHVIEKSLEQIPLDYRMVFSLREITGLNVAETAETLQISESNVKVRLNRAKSMLRKQIENEYTAADIFEFNLVYCDDMVRRVMKAIKNHA
jgi:RNA polymerase sigma factor (sigma-70 family)